MAALSPPFLATDPELATALRGKIPSPTVVAAASREVRSGRLGQSTIPHHAFPPLPHAGRPLPRKRQVQCLPPPGQCPQPPSAQSRLHQDGGYIVSPFLLAVPRPGP